MLKFIVVLYKRQDLSAEHFRNYFRTVHGPLAERLPDLRRYVQNFVAEDAHRKHPGWDAVVELYFDDRASMEAAWASPEGIAATEDLKNLADLERSSWSVVEECVVRA